MIPLSAYPPGNDHISHLGEVRKISLKTAYGMCEEPRRVTKLYSILKSFCVGLFFNSSWPFAHPKRPPFKRIFQSPFQKSDILRICLFTACFLGEKNGSFLSTSTRLMVKVGDPKVKVPYHLEAKQLRKEIVFQSHHFSGAKM